MNIDLNTAFYIDGWEINGRLEATAVVTDASFSYSYGSINAVHEATDEEVTFLAFRPDDIAADLRRQSEYFPRMTRKRLRKFRRQLAKRLASRLDERAFNEWMNEGGEKRIWEAYQDGCDELDARARRRRLGR